MTINTGPVQYKGDDLDPERGPGLGCFRFQLIVLAIFIVLTPLTVAWQWPEWISTVLLFAVLILLLVTGQTIIFLLRLVAADRRSRRRPLGSATKTVGELEDAAGADGAAGAAGPAAPRADGGAGADAPRAAGADPEHDDTTDPRPDAATTSSDRDEPPPSDVGPVRQ